MYNSYLLVTTTYVQLKQIAAKVSKPKIPKRKISHFSTNHFDKLG